MNTLKVGFTFTATDQTEGLFPGLSYTVLNYGVVNGRVEFVLFEDQIGDYAHISGRQVRSFFKALEIQGVY